MVMSHSESTDSVNSLGEYTHLLHCLLPTFHLPFHPHFSIHKIVGMTQTFAFVRLFSTNNSIHFSVFSIVMMSITNDIKFQEFNVFKIWDCIQNQQCFPSIRMTLQYAVIFDELDIKFLPISSPLYSIGHTVISAYSHSVSPLCYLP